MAASAGSAPTSSIRCAPPSPERGSLSEPTRAGGPSTEAAGETLRLYGRRHGRKLRTAQQELLDSLLPRVRVPDGAAPIGDPRLLFDPPVDETWLEIGFGGGEHLAAQAEANPGVGLIGCEPFINGVVSALGHIARRQLANVRVWPDDARLLLDRLPDQAIGRAFILFPDPWPKARHHKRRIVSTENLDRLGRVLRDGAELRLASDDYDYIDWMLAHLVPHPAFEWTARRPADWRERPPDWPETRYEAKARASDVEPCFLRFRRRPR